MRALKHGLPMVVVPGLGGDQPVNAASAEAWGVTSIPRDTLLERLVAADPGTEMIGHDLALLWQMIAIDRRNRIPESDFQ